MVNDYIKENKNILEEKDITKLKKLKFENLVQENFALELSQINTDILFEIKFNLKVIIDSYKEINLMISYLQWLRKFLSFYDKDSKEAKQDYEKYKKDKELNIQKLIRTSYLKFFKSDTYIFMSITNENTNNIYYNLGMINNQEQENDSQITLSMFFDGDSLLATQSVDFRDFLSWEYFMNANFELNSLKNYINENELNANSQEINILSKHQEFINIDMLKHKKETLKTTKNYNLIEQIFNNGLASELGWDYYLKNKEV
ncbi:hypothetical protein [Mycoplasma buteonis]|uniref:hypothetical protein n=1 Tax=Mycoplasma buteonis TaxID=171280 RepID=UPI0005649D06|nr:hypothetical protein [Mycoplasma buteonis]